MVQRDNYRSARARAIAFLKSKRQDFHEAVSILEEAKFKPIYVAKIKSAGENADTRKGLITTLCQLIRLWANPTSVEMADEMEVMAPVASNISGEQIAKMDVIFSDSDTPAGKLIRHFSELYKTRAKLHRSLSEIGEKNDEQSVARRKTILVSMAAISMKMDAIWPYIDEYDASHVQPSPEVVEGFINGEADSSKNSSYDTPGKGGEDAQGLPEAYYAMTRAQLVAERKLVAARIRRTRNKIEYQAEAVAGKAPNPLPAGSPRRVKLENRIGNLERLLLKLDLRIAEFG